MNDKLKEKCAVIAKEIRDLTGAREITWAPTQDRSSLTFSYTPRKNPKPTFLDVPVGYALSRPREFVRSILLRPVE